MEINVKRRNKQKKIENHWKNDWNPLIQDLFLRFEE